MMGKKVSVRKVLQALYYIQNNAPVSNVSRTNIVYLLKLMFFADRYHLRHFGILATGSSYYAMKYGPVALEVCDIIKGNIANINSAEMFLLSDIEAVSEYDYIIKQQDSDELSDSFKQAMQFAIKTYGKYSHFDLSDISHDYPEWSKHKKELESGVKRVEMSCLDFFENPEKLVVSKKFGISQDPFVEDAEFLNAMKQELLSNAISC